MLQHEAWLKLALIPGIGDVALLRLLEAFGTPEAALAATRSQLLQHISPKQADALLAGPDDQQLAETQAWLGQHNHHLVTWLDEDYPYQLREIADPPVVLYAKGQRGLLSRNCLAVVGSRNATPQGEANAEAFAQTLSDAGITIVSGLALGIDAAAHR